MLRTCSWFKSHWKVATMLSLTLFSIWGRVELSNLAIISNLPDQKEAFSEKLESCSLRWFKFSTLKSVRYCLLHLRLAQAARIRAGPHPISRQEIGRRNEFESGACQLLNSIFNILFFMTLDLFVVELEVILRIEDLIGKVHRWFECWIV